MNIKDLRMIRCMHRKMRALRDGRHFYFFLKMEGSTLSRWYIERNYYGGKYEDKSYGI